MSNHSDKYRLIVRHNSATDETRVYIQKRGWLWGWNYLLDKPVCPGAGRAYLEFADIDKALAHIEELEGWKTDIFPVETEF